MYSRPKRGENEDDVLKYQELFYRNKTQPCVAVVRKSEGGDEPIHNLGDNQNPGNKRPRSRFSLSRGHVKRENNMKSSVGLTTVVGDVQEKVVDISSYKAAPIITSQKGFPEVFQYDRALTGKGRSIFAQQIAKQRGDDILQKTLPELSTTSTFGDRSSILSGPEALRIHKENVERLNQMSIKEIQAEQQKLISGMDQKLLDFLQSRRQKQSEQMDQKNVSAIPSCTEMEVEIDSKTSDVEPDGELRVPSPLAMEANKWLHMDVVEYDKLKWVGDIPPAKAIPPDKPYTARFDLQGLLLPYGESDIDVRQSLHHHGAEPERPGYSLEELIQLTRSSVLQQRVLSLTIIASILEKTKKGYYDECLQEALVGRLLDSEFFLLLRFSLDDNTEAVFTAALLAMRNLLISEADELCLDRAMGFADCVVQPSLSVMQDVQPGKEQQLKEEEAELRDHETLRLDVVKGALRTDLVLRLRYILEVLRPGPKAVIAILEILTRLVRHSYDAALAITCCPRLENIIVTHFLPRDWKSVVDNKRPEEMGSVYGVPLAKALRLLRVISCQSRNLASDLIHKHGVMDSIISYISVDPNECGLPRGEALDLSLESLYLWHALLAYNLATQHFVDLYPVFMRFLMFHLAYTSASETEVTFGHNHGAALIALLEQAMKTAHAQDSHLAFSHSVPRTLSLCHVQGFLLPLEKCLNKWISQLTRGTELVFSALKLIGATFNCMATYYTCCRSKPNVDVVSLLEAMEEFCRSTLLSFLQSPLFEQATASAKKCSGLLYGGKVGTERDPVQLPSLGALMWNGQQLTPILLPSSPIPLLQGLADFLTGVYMCYKNVSKQCVAVFLGNASLVDYLRQVAQEASAHLASQWFTRFEIAMLVSIVKLAHTQNSLDINLYHQLALKLVTLMQRDDKILVKEIMSQIIFNPFFFQDCCTLTQDLAALKMIDSPLLPPVHSCQLLLQDAINNLPHLWDLYERILNLQGLQRSNPLEVKGLTATEKGKELILPVDWSYLPILYLHNSGLSGQRTDNTTSFQVVQALQWIMLMEWVRPEVVRAVNVTDRFCRLATVFLAGSDLFLESRVHALLAAGLAHLMQYNHKIKFPPSFYDLYTQLLEQFAAVSYGDTLFGHFLLVALQQRHPVSLRKLVWSEQAAVLRVLHTSLEELMFPLDELLEPCETDLSLLTNYFQCLVKGKVRPEWSPILFEVAVHHVVMFTRMNTHPVANQFIAEISGLSNKELQLCLMNYVPRSNQQST